MIYCLLVSDLLFVYAVCISQLGVMQTETYTILMINSKILSAFNKIIGNSIDILVSLLSHNRQCLDFCTAVCLSVLTKNVGK